MKRNLRFTNPSNFQIYPNSGKLKAYKSLLFPQFIILWGKINFTQDVHLSVKSAD